MEGLLEFRIVLLAHLEEEMIPGTAAGKRADQPPIPPDHLQPFKRNLTRRWRPPGEIRQAGEPAETPHPVGW